MHWLDALTAPFAPRWTLQRQRARMAVDLLGRHYEAAASGRRTQGWQRPSSDANSALGPAGARMREIARDLVRNNPYAESAVATIADHTVGWGIMAKPSMAAPKAAQNQAARIWQSWAETTACDADGRLDFVGLQKQVMQTVVESGEVLIRRRWRRPEDNLPVPMQIQVLEPDYIDSSRDGVTPSGGVRIIQGVIFGPIGQRIAYQLYQEHPGASTPGSTGFGFGSSDRVPASEVLHIFKPRRPGQVRGASWFAPVALRMKDFDDYEDAALMKQKIAACLAVLTTDTTGTATALGGTNPQDPTQDMLEPGMIMNMPLGRSVQVVQPPSVNEYGAYAETVLRAIATGLGVTYEDLSGSYANMPFSAARMSRLRHWARVEDWRWRMLIPQFCDPVWGWVMQAAAIGGQLTYDAPSAEWTCPPAPMVDPAAEGLAYQRNIRSGIMTLSEAIRERGYDPDSLMAEMAADNEKIDELGLILDSDARYTTQQGNARTTGSAPADTTPTDLTPSVNGNGKVPV